MKKLSSAQILATFLFAVSAWGAFLIPNVYANEIGSQLDSSTLSAGGFIYRTAIASSTTGNLKTVQMYLKDPNTLEPMQVCLSQQTAPPTAPSGSDCTGVPGLLGFTDSFTPTASKAIYNFTFATPILLDATKQYWLLVIPQDGTANTSFDMYGTTSGTQTNCWINNPPTTACPSSVKTLFYDLYDNAAVSILGAQVNTTAPTQNQIFGSPWIITFTGSYAHTSGLDLYDTIGYSLVDVNGIASFNVATATISNQGTFNFTLTLPRDDSYQFYPYLYDSASSSYPILQGPSIFFSTGTSTGLVGSIVATTTDFTSFLNVPNLLKTRAPFAYIYLTAVLLTDLNNNATSSIPSGSFSVTLPLGHASTTINVDMFSTTTITHFLPSDMLSLFRTLMVAVLVVGTAMYLFKRTQSLLK